MYLEDRVRGMLWCHAVGDALGAPYEFRRAAPDPSDVEMDSFTISRRYQGNLEVDAGSTTDDSEMTIACARGLLAWAEETDAMVASAPGSYPGLKNPVVEFLAGSYIRWAAHCSAMGRNTRRLFKGIKTIRGFRDRHEVRFFASPDRRSPVRPNGALMRCSPLAVLPPSTMDVFAETDCWLTNPNRVSVDACLVYLHTLRGILSGDEPGDAVEAMFEYFVEHDRLEYPRGGSGVRPGFSTYVDEVPPRAWDPEVAETVRHAWYSDEPRPEVGVKATKGFILHALWCAFRGLRTYVGLVSPDETGSCHPTPVGETLKRIIALPGNTDTDTNAAIAGALLGAAAGYEGLTAEPGMAERMETMLAAGKPGDEDRMAYHVRHVDELAQQLVDVYA